MAFDPSSAALLDEPKFDPSSAALVDDFDHTTATPVEDKPGASISGWGALPVPQWMTNAVEGVSNAAKAFVPESIRNDPMGLVTLGPETLNQLRDVAATMSPASGSIEELKKAHEIVSGVINGDTFEQATRKAAPDALELADAGKTPALSKERFQAATNVAAQMLMAAGIVHSHVKAGEVPKDVPASPNPEPSEQSTVQGPMEVPPSAPSDNPAMARFQPAAQDQLRPALRLKDGSVITGNPGQLHADMMDALPKDVQESIDYKDRGFTNAAGNYLDPEQAFRWAKNRGVNVDALDSAEAGQLDASELSKVNPPSVPSATEANSALGKPNETVSSTERPVGDSAPTGETLGGSNEPPSSAPGAAVGAEPVRSAVDETPISTKNAVTDEARISAGLPDRVSEAAGKDFGKRTWEASGQRMAEDPQAGQRLVQDINSGKSAAIDAADNALLLREQIKTRIEHSSAVDAKNAAIASGDGAAVDAATLRLNQARDHYQAVLDATAKAGTELSRGFSARKLMAKEDYSLARMEATVRAAQGGKRIGERQSVYIQELQKRIEKLENQSSKYQVGNVEPRKARAKIRPEAVKARIEGKTMSEFLKDSADEARRKIEQMQHEGINCV